MATRVTTWCPADLPVTAESPMQASQMLAELTKASAFGPDDSWQPPHVIETHASVVLITKNEVFKLKKAVDFGFLDYSSADKRKFFCEQEVRLNRALGGSTYLGVVPIVATPQGSWRFALEHEYQPELTHDPGCAWVETCVHMRRLSHAACLHTRVVEERWRDFTAKSLSLHTVMKRLGEKMAAFHAAHLAPASERHHASYEAVALASEENLQALETCQAIGFDPSMMTTLRSHHQRELQAARELIQERMDSPFVARIHGDLRLDHVYLLDDRTPDLGLVIIDCVEFSPRFSFNDGVADVAFLAMELRRYGRDDLARAFLAAYFAARQDANGAKLLPLYETYRALVRAKVAALRFEQAQSPAAAEQAKAEVWAHLHVAQRALGYRALTQGGLLLIGGLPGTGKSTLSVALIDRLARQRVIVWIRADQVRKEMLATLSDELDQDSPGFERGLYRPELRNRVYEHCLSLARHAMVLGQVAVIDATFAAIEQRQRFINAALELALPWCFVECRLAPEIVAQRLAARHDGPSQADWLVYQAMAAQWPDGSWLPDDGVSSACATVVDTATPIDQQVESVVYTAHWLTGRVV